MRTTYSISAGGVWTNYIAAKTFTLLTPHTGDEFPVNLNFVKITGFTIKHHGTFYASRRRSLTVYNSTPSNNSIRLTNVISVSTGGSQEDVTNEFIGLSSQYSYLQTLLFGNSGFTVCISVCKDDGNYTTVSNQTGVAGLIELIVDWTYAYEKTTFTPENAYVGSTMKITFKNISTITELNHKINYVIDNNPSYSGLFAWYDTGDITTSTLVKTIPISNEPLMYLTTKKSAPIQLTLSTYYGDILIGTDVKTVTLTVPEDYRPIIHSAPPAMISSSTVVNNWGVYVQGYSSVKFIISASSNDSFVNLVKYTLRFGSGSPITSTTNVITTELTDSGLLSYYITVEDSRGMVSDQYVGSIYVYPYERPKLTVVEYPYRCNSVGTGSVSGMYGAGTFVGEIASVGGKNIMTLQIGVTSSTYISPTIVANDITSGQRKIFGGSYSVETTYYVYYYVKDSLNITYDYFELSTSAYAFHVKNGGDGVAFGKTSEHSNAVEISKNWNFYIHDQEIDQRYMKANSIEFHHVEVSGPAAAAVSTSQATNSSIEKSIDVPENSTIVLTGWNIYNAGYRNFYPYGIATVEKNGDKAKFKMTIANTVTSPQTMYISFIYAIIK